MKIAIIADDAKKELMAEFCLAYCGLLSGHELCATSKTAKHISEATGLPIDAIPSGALGGIDHLVSRVTYDEVDMLLYLRDPIGSSYKIPEINELLRVCDMFNVPLATNLAVAEVLLLALGNGNLNWRDVVREKRQTGAEYGGNRAV